MRSIAATTAIPGGAVMASATERAAAVAARVIRRGLGLSIKADPNPSAVFGLAQGLKLSAVSQNVSDGDNQQEPNQNANDDQYFQGRLLKSGDRKNV